jgi:hypothetical protein
VSPILPCGSASRGIDGAVAAAVAVVAIAINAMGLRWIAGEPIPEPEPFSTIAPSADEIARQRALLLHHLRESRRPV